MELLGREALENTLRMERQLIGAILCDPEATKRINGLLEPTDMFGAEHATALSGALTLHAMGKDVDLVSLTEQTGQNLREIGEMAREYFTSANLEAWAKILRTSSQKRKLIEGVHSAVSRAMAQRADSLNDLVADLSSLLDKVQRGYDSEMVGAEQMVRHMLDDLEEAEEHVAKHGMLGIPWGIKALDDAVGGMTPGRVYGIAARPSLGKTALANQVAFGAAQRGRKVAMMSLEMTESELMMRAVSCMGSVNFTSLYRAEKSAIEAAVGVIRRNDIGKMGVWADTNTFTLSGIVAKLTEAKRRHGIDLAVIDHLALIEVPGAKNIYETVGTSSRTIKKLAKTLGIPIILAIQLNRSNEKESRRPRLSDLRDSGNIEQDLDVGVFIHSDETPDSTNPEVKIQFGMLKNRTGKRGWSSSEIYFHGRHQRFVETSHGSERLPYADK